MNIILLGPQGSGKGTQAKLLVDELAFTHISTGDLIRNGIKNKDPVALKVKESIDKGNLAPDKVVIQLVKKNLSDNNIFDGFPRTLLQAEALDEIAHIDLVIALELSDEESVKRLSSRIQCVGCKSIFGPAAPPKKKGVCDSCGGKLIQREDDKPESILKRLEVYHDETEPLLEYYRPRKIVHAINAAQSIDKIFTDIKKIIQTVV